MSDPVACHQYRRIKKLRAEYYYRCPYCNAQHEEFVKPPNGKPDGCVCECGAEIRVDPTSGSFKATPGPRVERVDHDNGQNW